LLSWTSDSTVVLPMPEPKPKPQRSALPVLVVLFLISYGLLALLVVEQGRTIENQRFLIRSLLSDSTELSHLKGKAFQEQRAAAQAQAAAKAHSQVQTPSTQDKTQNQSKPNQAQTSRNPSKLQRPAPERPPRDAVDRADERRTVLTI
jgi:hypothetical protein